MILTKFFYLKGLSPHYVWNDIIQMIATESQMKKSSGVESHDLGGQFTSPPRNDHSQKLLVQNIHPSLCCVARSVVLFKPHVWQIHILDFRPIEVGYHRRLV